MRKDSIKLFYVCASCCILSLFLLTGCISYVLSGFTIIEKSKFITPSWCDKESFFVQDGTLVYVEKLTKQLDLPLALKQAQKISIENSKKSFSSYLNETLLKKMELSGVKVKDKSIIKQIASQHSAYVKDIQLRDLYYEKMAGEGSQKDYYDVYVIDQLQKQDYIKLCSSIIYSLKRQKVDFKGLVDILNEDPMNCLAE